MHAWWSGARLVDEQHPRHQFRHTSVDVPVDYLQMTSAPCCPAARLHSARLVDLLAQFVGDLCFLGLHHLSNHGHEILSTLRPGIGGIKIVQRDILWANCC